MSEFTTTPKLGLYKPNYDSDDEMWGYHLNTNADVLDSVVVTSDELVALVPMPSTSLPLADGTAAIGGLNTYARADHVHPASVVTGGTSVTIADTAPASPAHGDLWWCSADGQMYIRYDDGTSAQWVPVVNQPGADGAPGATGPAGPAGPTGPSGVTGSAARLQAQWVSGAVVANDTVWLAYDAPYAGTINALTYFTGNGSFSVAIQINGTNVTGLSAIAVSSATAATANASGANTFSAGARITAVVTAATGSPTDALLSLTVTWS